MRRLSPKISPFETPLLRPFRTPQLQVAKDPDFLVHGVQTAIVSRIDHELDPTIFDALVYRRALHSDANNGDTYLVDVHRT